MRRVIRSLPAGKCVLLLPILFCLGFCLGQPTRTFAQDPTGALRGTVEDTSGARVAGATIEVRAIDRSLVREAAADQRGEFRFDLLPPGKYQITANSAGFAPAHSEVAVTISSVRELDNHLTAGPRSSGRDRESASFFDHRRADRRGQRHFAKRYHREGSRNRSARASQLCEYRLSGAGD